METLSKRKSRVLEVLDEEIEDLEARLAKVQPLIDELNSLRATRARLLDERTSHSGGPRAGTLTMETVIQDLRDNGPSLPNDIAERIGSNHNTVRSHLNRHADVRYRKNGDGKWSLIGEDVDEDEADDE